MFVCTWLQTNKQSTKQSIDRYPHVCVNNTLKYYVPQNVVENSWFPFSIRSYNSILCILYTHKLCLTLHHSLASKETKYPQSCKIVSVDYYVCIKFWSTFLELHKVSSMSILLDAVGVNVNAFIGNTIAWNIFLLLRNYWIQLQKNKLSSNLFLSN